MSKLIVTEASLMSLPAFSRLFVEAVRSNFAYFPEDVQRRVIREHRLIKLLLGAADPRRILLTAHFEGRMIGYAIGAVPNSGPAQLYWLYVAPGHRGRNIGLKLLSRMLRLQEHKGAREVLIATYDHRRYYERQGFKIVGRQMVDGITMDIMAYTIGKSA